MISNHVNTYNHFLYTRKLINLLLLNGCVVIQPIVVRFSHLCGPRIKVCRQHLVEKLHNANKMYMQKQQNNKGRVR